MNNPNLSLAHQRTFAAVIGLLGNDGGTVSDAHLRETIATIGQITGLPAAEQGKVFTDLRETTTFFEVRVAEA